MGSQHSRFLTAMMLSCGLLAGETLQTATTHPMQYYASLPDGWSAARKWPVVMIIESADKEFEATAEAFRKARGKLPFVLVTPLAVSNGGARSLDAPTYHYARPVWDRVTKDGSCRFDTDGLAAVMSDMQKKFAAEDRYFITGLEAGGHTVWMQLFTKPEVLRGVAQVAPNYQGRCVDELGRSASADRGSVPVRVLGGANDDYWAAGKPLWEQTSAAERDAAAHGFGKVERITVPGKGHEWMPSEILAYFDSLYTRSQ